MKKQTLSTPTIRDVVFLRGKKVILRPHSEQDLPHLMKWINDPEVRRFILRYTPADEQTERAWLNSLHTKESTHVALVIQVNGVPIGNVSLGINWKERIGTVGIIIGEKRYWGKGLGTDASMTLIEYAFNTLNLRKIEWMAKSFNVRSIACAKACGFKVEGRLRDGHYVDGRYWDDVMCGLFRREWLPRWKAYQKKKAGVAS